MAFMGAGMGKKGILSCEITDVTELHKLYIPFIDNGGLFVNQLQILPDVRGKTL